MDHSPKLTLRITLEQKHFLLTLTTLPGEGVDPVRGKSPQATAATSATRRTSNGVDSQTDSYYHDLSDQLITALDKLLQRNSIDSSNIVSYTITGGLSPDSASFRIAQAFGEALIAS